MSQQSLGAFLAQSLAELAVLTALLGATWVLLS